MSGKIRTAVVGAGKMGGIHAKVYNSLDNCDFVGGWIGGHCSHIERACGKARGGYRVFSGATQRELRVNPIAVRVQHRNPC